MNVLEVRHGSGTFVTSLEPSLLVEPVSILFDTDRSSLLDLFDARLVLESGIARLAAVQISDREIDELEELVNKSVECVDDAV